MAKTWGDMIRHFRETDGLNERVADLPDDELMLVIYFMLDKIIEENRLSGTPKVS
jgi:hypothetical protein